MVGALLTQNTSWHNAEQSLVALTRGGHRSAEAISRLELQQLAELIRPSRYFNQKARRLLGVAGYVVAEYSGRVSELLRRPADQLRPELLSLPGIGPETADSILLYAAGYPVFVVDAYTRRIGARLGWFDDDINYDDLQAFFSRSLPADAPLFAEYHALLVRHAVDHCLTKPLCATCCLRRRCHYRAGAAAKSETLPRKDKP